jgi:hypothetical protein
MMRASPSLRLAVKPLVLDDYKETVLTGLERWCVHIARSAAH